MGKGGFNIFDAAGKVPEKKKKKPPAMQPTQKPIGPPPAAIGNANDALKKMQEMDEELQKKMDRICELCGMSRKQLENYIENPQNFASKAWGKAQESKEVLEQKILKLLGIEEKKKLTQQKQGKLEKERKGKTLGGRKGWLQM